MVPNDEAARQKLYKALREAGRDEWCTDYRTGLRTALDLAGTKSRPGERRLVIFLTDGLFDPDRNNDTYYFGPMEIGLDRSIPGKVIGLS